MWLKPIIGQKQPQVQRHIRVLISVVAHKNTTWWSSLISKNVEILIYIYSLVDTKDLQQNIKFQFSCIYIVPVPIRKL